MESYYSLHINEGFDLLSNKRLHFTDSHQEILNTSFEGEATESTIYSFDLDRDITVYSIFKRMKQNDFRSDSNPVLYALKKERGWSFANERDREDFWKRFVLLLRKFLRKHTNSYNTVLVVPSSNKLNKDIINEIKKYAKEFGIIKVIEQGLYTVSTETVLDSIYDENSYFRKYHKDDWEDYVPMLVNYLNRMDVENDGKFKYHIIDDMDLRQSIINTLELDDKYVFLYDEHVNGKDLLIVDDSITFGQSIRNTIHAISQAYMPKTVSVLTMFSKLYDKDGNEVNSMNDMYEILLRNGNIKKKEIQ